MSEVQKKKKRSTAEAAATDAVEPSLAEDAPPPPKKKKEKKKKEEPPAEAEAEETGEGAGAAQRRNRRVAGYREVARECGYTRGLGNIASVGYDAPASLLSAADARRCIKFLPENVEEHAFAPTEFKDRLRVTQESVPASAAREAQGRLEAVLRRVVGEAVLRTAESGKMRVTAAAMHQVLRPFAAQMRFTAVLPPKGLVREAQNAGILEADEEDAQQNEAETADIETLQGLLAEKLPVEKAEKKKPKPAKKAKAAKKAAA